MPSPQSMTSTHPTPLRRKAAGVVVLGMGRSGTSSVTNMFTEAGFFAGLEEDLMPPTEANPAGYWENTGIWRTNEDVLGRLGGSWFDPPSVAAQTAAREWALPRLRSEVERIARQSPDAPIVLKDPRIGVMMPLWEDILWGSLHPILVLRDPVEIALSLLHRDGTPPAFGLAAWEIHMATLLNHLQGRTVTVAPYQSLLGNQRLAAAIVESAAEEVEPRLTEELRPQNAHKAFDVALHRNQVAGGEHDEYLTSHQLGLWRFLSSLPAGNKSIEVPASLRAPSEPARMAVRLETERIEDHCDRISLSRERDAERERAEALTASLADERHRVARLIGHLQAERDRADTATESYIRAEHWLMSVQASTSWRATRPLRNLKRFLTTPSATRWR
jgi:hypothetical protein